MKKSTIIVLTFLGLPLPVLTFGQTLSLDSCQYYARENYPLLKSLVLNTNNKNLELANLQTSLKPAITMGGQATYQSDVTQLPFSLPGTTVNPLSRDQYKVYTDISQSIIPLFHKNEKEKLIEEQTFMNQKKIEVELHKLREVVMQTYFGILLVDGQLNQLKPVIRDIQVGIEKLHATQSAGTSSSTQKLILEAEKLALQQKQAALKLQKEGLFQVLSNLIQRPINLEQVLIFPDDSLLIDNINRSELFVFSSQKQITQLQTTIAKERLMPVIQIFGQAGYGRPGLNMLNNSFDFYFLGGVRIQYNLSNRYTYKNDMEKLKIQREWIDIEKDRFELNITLALDKQRAEIKKYQALIDQSSDIIKIRSEIKELAKNQLDNGIMSALDFLSYIEAEDLARQDLLFYKVQLAMAIENYHFIQGN